MPAVQLARGKREQFIISFIKRLDSNGNFGKDARVPGLEPWQGLLRQEKQNKSVHHQRVFKMKTSQKMFLAVLTAGCVAVATTPQANASYSSGTDHGYWWSLYSSGGSASISFPYAGSYAGNFQVNYNNVSDVVGGKGWSTGSSHTVGYNIGSLSGSYNNISVYGWTTSPLIEYYVCEKGSVGGSYVNSISSDGHTYSFYRQQRVNAPSIQGTQTFWQYKDQWGGTSTGHNHSVTMSNHINNWRNHGGHGFGNYNYQIFAIEAYGGKSGSMNATVW